MIAVIDYNAGNLHSVQNALNFLDAPNFISDNPDKILKADKIILPGVGAFGDAMSTLNKKNLTKTITTATDKGIPLLGICLGLQLLFEESEESPGVNGIGLLKGKFVKIPKLNNIKIPHMGWNSLEFSKPSKILKNIGSEPYVYFVHSYYLEPKDDSLVCAYTHYGKRLAVAVENNNIFATQFHPEKSGDIGLKILKNFIEL